jgi:hypothetical protein
MARPKLNIDPNQILKLAAMGCSNREIAAFVDCDESTIRDRFPAEVQKGRENGKTKLRRLMWQNAEKGNAVMQIWLSKNILGYVDKTEQSLVSKNEINVVSSMTKEQAQKLLKKEQLKQTELQSTEEKEPKEAQNAVTKGQE